MSKPTQWPCRTCGAMLSGRGGRRYCDEDCRPRCSVNACEKPVHTREMCSTHASRAAKYGDPLAPLLRQPVKGKTCTVDGCELPMRKHPYCANHYAMVYTSGEVRDWNHKWADLDQACVVCGVTVERGGDRRKHCSAACQVTDSRHRGDRPVEGVCDYCGETFPLSSRDQTGRLQRTDTKWCPDCGRDSPDVQRFRRYGVTREQYEAAQAAGCAICGATDRKLHIDHDHDCCPSNGGQGPATCGKCVRGFICGPCNRGLGLFGDNVRALLRAAEYLNEAHQQTRGVLPLML